MGAPAPGLHSGDSGYPAACGHLVICVRSVSKKHDRTILILNKTEVNRNEARKEGRKKETKQQF